MLSVMQSRMKYIFETHNTVLILLLAVSLCARLIRIFLNLFLKYRVFLIISLLPSRYAFGEQVYIASN